MQETAGEACRLCSDARNPLGPQCSLETTSPPERAFPCRPLAREGVSSPEEPRVEPRAPPQPAADRRKAPSDRRKVTRGGRRETDVRESKSSVPRSSENEAKGKS